MTFCLSTNCWPRRWRARPVSNHPWTAGSAPRLAALHVKECYGYGPDRVKLLHRGYDQNGPIQVKRIGQTRVEWALLAVIAIVCAGLTVLQYRWTGELSQAEPALLRAGLNDLLRRVSQAFDTGIRESCTTLRLGADEIRQSGAAGALQNRYTEWALSHDRNLFARIGMAALQKRDLVLYGIDKDGRVGPMEWPGDWEHLRAAMKRHLTGFAPPPDANPDSNLILMPVFAGESRPELGWMIFEINEDYVRGTLVPRVVAEYLRPIQPDYDVSVNRARREGPAIFSTRSDGASVASGADVTAGLLSLELAGANGRGPGRPGDDAGRYRWTIAVRHSAGSLEAAVATARRRNLLVSWILIALLGGMAWALVRFTGRSRRLAETQFRFAAGVSHDLRTPLTAIRGAAFNLLEGVVQDPAAVTRYLRLILRNAEELTAMIENVLAFSASVNARKPGAGEAMAIGDVVQRAVAAMMPDVEEAGCRLELNIAEELPTVAGDPVAVELVFRNLIGNAVRHGVGGKWIAVSAAPCGDGVEVRVCDHGPGIPEGERQRIFEPFYRGEQTRAQRVPGTGLGLSLVKNTIERYRGSVEVVNSTGGGAQFTVRLPAALQHTA